MKIRTLKRTNEALSNQKKKKTPKNHQSIFLISFPKMKMLWNDLDHHDGYLKKQIKNNLYFIR